MNKQASNRVFRLSSAAFAALVFSFNAPVFAAAKVYDISQVTDVVVNNMGHLKLTQGETESLRVEADEDVLAAVRVDQTGGRLTLERKSGSRGWGWFNNHRDNVFYILQLKDVHSIEINGSSHGEIGAFKAKNMVLRLSGASHAEFSALTVDSSDFNVSGASHLEVKTLTTTQSIFDVSGASHAEVESGSQTQTLEADVSGASHLELSALQSITVKVDASGASHANVWATGSLAASASGVSRVSYRGEPQLKKRDTSGGSHRGTL